jgi:hypothetical protein
MHTSSGPEFEKTYELNPRLFGRCSSEISAALRNCETAEERRAQLAALVEESDVFRLRVIRTSFDGQGSVSQEIDRKYAMFLRDSFPQGDFSDEKTNSPPSLNKLIKLQKIICSSTPQETLLLREYVDELKDSYYKKTAMEEIERRQQFHDAPKLGTQLVREIFGSMPSACR